jgi:hypothetical protein
MPIFDYPYEKLGIKIVETFEKGVGALFVPWQTRRKGRADSEVRQMEIVAVAQAEVMAEEIRQGRKAIDINGTLVALPAPKDDSSGGVPEDGDAIGFINAAKIEADYLAVRRAINLRKILLNAEDEASDTPNEEVSEKPVDPDWFARWRDAAQDVSNEEMQQIWARLLKGEVKNPGNFSLQTINLVRNIGEKQANWIASLGQFVLGELIWLLDAPSGIRRFCSA